MKRMLTAAALGFMLCSCSSTRPASAPDEGNTAAANSGNVIGTTKVPQASDKAVIGNNGSSDMVRITGDTTGRITHLNEQSEK